MSKALVPGGRRQAVAVADLQGVADILVDLEGLAPPEDLHVGHFLGQGSTEDRFTDGRDHDRIVGLGPDLDPALQPCFEHLTDTVPLVVVLRSSQ